jgi:O-antigen/teichoic acid export membrane protein
MTRTQRSVWSYLSGLALTAGTIVVGFVATPFLLRYLGAERYGAFRVACDWAGYLGLLELGLGGALIPLLARAVTDGGGAVRDTIAAGVAAYIRVTLAMLAGGVLLALAVGRLIPVSPAAARDLRWGCWVGLLVTLFVPLSPLRMLAEAHQRGYLVNSLRLLQS